MIEKRDNEHADDTHEQDDRNPMHDQTNFRNRFEKVGFYLHVYKCSG
jgi:hypothetical protein